MCKRGEKDMEKVYILKRQTCLHADTDIMIYHDIKNAKKEFYRIIKKHFGDKITNFSEFENAEKYQSEYHNDTAYKSENSTSAYFKYIKNHGYLEGFDEYTLEIEEFEFED